MYIFVDGVKINSVNDSSTTTLANDANVSIGNSGSSYTTNDFTGQIDDVRIYNYARTQAQIIEDMNAGHPAPGSPVGSATAYWNFDEGYNSTANDSSVNNLDLTLSTASWTNSGKFGKAFNGATNIRASIADNPALEPNSLEDFAISTWFKSDGLNTAATEYVISKMSSSAGYQMYFNTSGYLICGIDDDASGFPEDSTTTGTDYYDTTWHHAVCVRDITTDKLLLYVDGVLKATDPDLSATGSLAGTNITFYIGDQNGTDDTDEFLGDVDDTKFFRSLITADQVKLLYNQSSSSIMGSVSTDSSGNPSWSATNEYCPPGQGTACVGPVGHWKMDEKTGISTINDTSGNCNTGTMNGSMTESDWVPGKFGSALDFDGSNDYVSVNYDVGSTMFVTLWVKPNALGTKKVIFSWKNVYSESLMLYDDRWNFYSNTSPVIDIFPVSPTPTVGKWHHIAFGYDAGVVAQLYVDGVLIGSTTNLLTPDTSTVTIGGTSIGDYFSGVIDDVKIYNHALTATQVKTEYAGGAVRFE